MTREQHDDRVAYDLACLGIQASEPPPPIDRGDGHVYDVVIVGGGQSGLGAAFGLLRERIPNIMIIDENPAGQEGPWDTYARMVTLRTPKQLTSIDFGVPSLTFRAYWEAAHGSASWDALDKIPRRDWMDYLRWYRQVLRLPMRNGSRLERVEPVERGLFRLHLHTHATLLARKVVFATGIQGGGQWHTPSLVKKNVSPQRYAHTCEMIDYEALKGRRIAILGGGASAFDNAQHALGLGAGEVHVFVRRAALPTVNPIRHMESTGMIARFPALPDEIKYSMMVSFFERNQPPTNDTFERAAAQTGFHLHLGAPWIDLKEDGEGVVVMTPKGLQRFDYLILSTGLVTDPTLRPELRDFASDILCWSDVPVSPQSRRDALIDAHPYLGKAFEFLPRRPEAADRLHGLFAFNYSGIINFGLSASALSGLKHALPRLAAGIADQLFLDNQSKVVEQYLAYDEPEFIGRWPRPEAMTV